MILILCGLVVVDGDIWNYDVEYELGYDVEVVFVLYEVKDV